MPSVVDTIMFIKEAHAGQVDKSGHPFWHHPVSVCFRLGAGATESERKVALLHDIIEDTDFAADDLLAMGYTQEEVTAVQLLSRPPKDTPNRPTYIDWIKSIIASGNQIAIKVEIADAEENSDPARFALMTNPERGLIDRYKRSLELLRPALASLMEVQGWDRLDPRFQYPVIARH